jgi:xanthine/uracil permease
MTGKCLENNHATGNRCFGTTNHSLSSLRVTVTFGARRVDSELRGAMGIVLGIIGGNVAAYFLEVPPVIPVDWRRMA